VIQKGSKGRFVTLWQRYLNKSGFPCGEEDGVFGNKVHAATVAFQQKVFLEPDGVVGSGTFRKAVRQGWDAPDGYPYMEANRYHVAERKEGDVLWGIVHTMEVPEKSYIAFEIGQRFCDNHPFSPHLCIDDTDVIQNVLFKDVAIHASQVNRKSIGIEHAGYAKQFPADWRDDFSEKMLKLSAKAMAKVCRRFGIPPVWLTGPDLKADKKGITGHKQVNDAFNDGKGHYDPGPHFPHEEYVGMVRQILGA
jgi:hypothetical protein